MKRTLTTLIYLLMIITLLAACSPETKLSSEEVVNAFVEAGLEASPTYKMTHEDYGMAPLLATEATRFVIPSLCDDCGGRIFSFDNQEDLEKTKEYYVSLGESSAIFFSWVFEHNNILVQINGDLPEETAMLYKAALERMKP